MAKIIFIEPGGGERAVTAEDGHSLMETAIRNGVGGIEADCGGACACATCHVYIAPEWRAALGAPTPAESEMLDFAARREETSRLSCQIRISAALDGLIVRMPQSQH